MKSNHQQMIIVLHIDFSNIGAHDLLVLHAFSFINALSVAESVKGKRHEKKYRGEGRGNMFFDLVILHLFPSK